MTIFGYSRLGRVAYALLFVLLIGLDFVKEPIRQYALGLQNAAANAAMEPLPATPGKKSAANDLFSPEKITGLDKDNPILARIKAEHRLPTEAEKKQLKEQITAHALGYIAKTMIAPPPEVAERANNLYFFNALYPLIMWCMTGISILGLLFLVSSRVRDIGWPQHYMWVFLAPFFIPKLFYMPLPQIFHSLLFYFAIAVIGSLAFFPSEDSGGEEFEEVSAAPLISKPRNETKAAIPIQIRQKTPRFGRLGANDDQHSVSRRPRV